nr:unnamed protein product [Digitaria exilis]
MLTLTTEKETSQGWNVVASRCDIAVSAASLSNSSSHATATMVGAGAAAAATASSSSMLAGVAAAPAAGSASFRVWFLGGRWARRSELSGDIFGPFQQTSTNTFASASGDPSGDRGAGGGGRPSARRTTSRTRKFRGGGGRGHRIIFATITGGQRTLLLRRGRKKLAFRQETARRPHLPTTSNRNPTPRQKDRAPRPIAANNLGSAPRTPSEDLISAPKSARSGLESGEEDGSRSDFGGGIGIRGADLCRGGSGRELRRTRGVIGTGIYEERCRHATRRQE